MPVTGFRNSLISPRYLHGFYSRRGTPLGRFLRWRVSPPGRELLGTEGGSAQPQPLIHSAASQALTRVRTGKRSRSILKAPCLAALYEAHLAQFRGQYQPVSDQELALVQTLADTHWRIARIPSLEMAIYALGRLEFADLFPDHDEASRKILIDAKVFLTYHRQLVNLGIQEGRLRRQAEKDLAALRALQQPRLQATQAHLNEAAQLYINAVHSGRQQEYDPEALGFEFTIDQIELRALDLQPDLFDDWAVQPLESDGGV